MKNKPTPLSGGIRQIETPEEVAKERDELKKRVELLEGMLCMTLPMLGGPLIFTQEVIDDENDRRYLGVHPARQVLSARDAFDFGLQLQINMDVAQVAVVKDRKASDIMSRRIARAATPLPASPSPTIGE